MRDLIVWWPIVDSISYPLRNIVRNTDTIKHISPMRPLSDRPPPVAVVMPIYNGARHLEESVQSALRQEGVEYEVWVSDDGSTDGSSAILDKYRCPMLHVLPPGRRLGLFGNLNRLVRACRSPFIHILCQDDILEANCLAKDLERFSRSPRVGITFTKSITIDEVGRTLGRGALYDLPNTMRPELALQHFFYHGCIPSNLSTVGLRKSALAKVGPFDEAFRVSGDYELWTRICRDFEMGVIHAHTVRIRSHQGQLSRADSSGPKFVSENRLIRRRLVPELPPSVQRRAGSFERLRFTVLDFHYGLRLLARGNARTARRVFETLGLRDTVLGALSWLISINNRLFRPPARFVLPSNYSVAPSPHLTHPSS